MNAEQGFDMSGGVEPPILFGNTGGQYYHPGAYAPGEPGVYAPSGPRQTRPTTASGPNMNHFSQLVPDGAMEGRGITASGNDPLSWGAIVGSYLGQGGFYPSGVNYSGAPAAYNTSWTVARENGGAIPRAQQPTMGERVNAYAGNSGGSTIAGSGNIGGFFGGGLMGGLTGNAIGGMNRFLAGTQGGMPRKPTLKE